MEAGAKPRDSSTRPDSTAMPESRGRVRTFTGCRTCRSRHFKCDEARPSCSPCLRLNLECEGYESRLLWLPESGSHPSSAYKAEQPASSALPNNHRATSYRYPLYTEALRHSLSVELVASLGSASASAALQKVDAVEAPGIFCHLEGPFGVFRPGPWGEQGQGEAASEEEEKDERESEETQPLPERSFDCPKSLSEPAVGSLDDDNTEEIIAPSAWITEQHQLSALDHSWMDGDADMGLGIFDDFLTDASFLYASPMSPQTHFIGGGLLSPSNPVSCNNTALSRQSRPQSRVPSRNPSPAPQWPGIPPTPSLPGATKKHGLSTVLPPSAAPLLRFYRERAQEGSSAPMNARTSPWRLLVLPRALETYAELSLWSTASHTRCSIFYSVLTQAALKLAQSPDIDPPSQVQWMTIAQSHQTQAREHLKRALEHEFDGEQRAEYTELLMSLLATALVSVSFHGSAAANTLLVDAERLIRLRGFPRCKTYNSRMLHHLYTHLRILIESTRHPTAVPDQSSRGCLTGSGTNVTTDTQVAATLCHFTVNEDTLGSDLDFSQEKPPDIGYRDIHLEISGNWPATLYHEIYGIPESLVTLLSQTVSLANSKPKLDSMAASNPAISAALSQHVKIHEKNIWSWSADSTPNLPAGPGRPDDLVGASTELWEHSQTRRMIIAMHQAVIVYFYRKIYNMSAMLLQESVRKALDHLKPCLDVFLEDQDFAATIAWCSFIVACEAVSPDLQEKAAECLRKTDEIGILLTTQKPSDVARAVWERRSQTRDWSYSWSDILTPGGAAM